MAPGNKPKSKDKPKNQNGQGTQAPSNGGQSVSVQSNQIGWGDGNMNMNPTGLAGQNYSMQQPAFVNVQGYPQQYHNQTLSAGNMQNHYTNMNTSLHSQGQGQGQISQNTQQNTVQYDQGNMFCGPQQNMPVNNISVDNSTIVNMIQQLNNNFMGRLSNIEHSVAKLNTIECEISYMRSDMSKLQLENASMSRRMTEVEKSCQTISNMFDDAAKSRSVLQTDVSVLKNESSHLRCSINDNVSKFEERCSTLNSELQELKARSMQSNLVFYGIAEAPRGDADNTESKLRDFLKHELDLEGPEKVNEIVFDRVHRLGRPKWDQHENPRPIVAKFERYKDREFIRQNSKTLNERRCAYYIREQFPPAIEATRKLLYPVMRQYSRDPSNRVALVRDKLYINGRLYVLPDSDEPKLPSRDTQQRDLSQGNRRRARGVRLAQLPSFESRNKFGPLAFPEDNSDINPNPENPYKSGKRPASSPAYDETSLKKYHGYGARHENSSHDNSFTDMQTTEGTEASANRQEPSEPVTQHTQNDPSLEEVVMSQPLGSQASIEDPINIVVSESETSHVIQNDGLQCNESAPVTSADKLPVNCQTVTVEVHQESCQVDNVNGDNGLNSATHGNFD